SVVIVTELIFTECVCLAIDEENIILFFVEYQWLDLAQPFQILALSLLFRSSHKIGDTIVKAKGAVYYRAMINWIYAVMVLLFAYIGHFYGLKGVATGALIATLLHYIFTTILAVNVTKIQLRQLL